MLEPEQEEKETPLVINPMMFGLGHQKVIQQQAVLGDLLVARLRWSLTLLLGQYQNRVEISPSLRQSCLQAHQLYQDLWLLTWWKSLRLVCQCSQLG